MHCGPSPFYACAACAYNSLCVAADRGWTVDKRDLTVPLTLYRQRALSAYLTDLERTPPRPLTEERQCCGRTVIQFAKKERVRKRIYLTRDMARADIVDYIEVFYNRTRRHSHLGGVSPEAFEKASP